MTRPLSDFAASVRARLLRRATERGEDFEPVLTRYANERVLQRLAHSPYAGQFILKGSTLFTIWTGQPHRATRDVDLLGFGDPSIAGVRAVFADILALHIGEDGVRFDEKTLRAGPIREGQVYQGVRVAVQAYPPSPFTRVNARRSPSKAKPPSTRSSSTNQFRA